MVALLLEDWALPQINLRLCKRCGTCVEACPAGAVEMGADGPWIARPEACTYCAACESLCPQHAVGCAYEIVWGTDT